MRSSGGGPREEGTAERGHSTRSKKDGGHGIWRRRDLLYHTLTFECVHETTGEQTLLIVHRGIRRQRLEAFGSKNYDTTKMVAALLRNVAEALLQKIQKAASCLRLLLLWSEINTPARKLHISNCFFALLKARRSSRPPAIQPVQVNRHSLLSSCDGITVLLKSKIG